MTGPWVKHYPAGVPEYIDIPDIPLSVFLERTAADHPDYIAATLNEVDLTYDQINDKVNGMAHGLVKLGVKKGDRVALLLPNSPTYIIAFYALMKIGAVAANINVSIHGEELKTLLVDSEARILITLDLFLQNVYQVVADTPVREIIIHSVFGQEKKIDPGPLPEPRIFNDIVTAHSTEEPGIVCSGDDVAVLQYTSGTTGTPIAAVLPHRNIVASVIQATNWIRLEKDPGNAAVICIIPFFHVFGMSAGLHLSVCCGYRMILVPMFNVFDALPLMKLIEQYRPISLPAVPSLWATLVSSPRIHADHFSSVEAAISGGAPLPTWVSDKYEGLTGKKILEAYGLTEASSATHFTPHPHGAPPGCIGLPLPNTDAKIVDIESGRQECPQGDVGELVVRGPQIMKEYWRKPDLTAAALRQGWLHTGDLARMDVDGFFYLVDRIDDLIISSGFNVYPSEVEKVLFQHPLVKDAAVIGVPARLRGESVVAFVVPEEPDSLTKEDLLDHCRGHMAEYKVPKSIIFRDEIPKNPLGKPLRKMLRAEAVN